MAGPALNRNHKTAMVAALASVAMLGAAYASVPLYRIFCQVTGFQGTTQRAESAPGKVLDKTIVVRFDGNTSSNLKWNFHPLQTAVTVKLGEQTMAYYQAKNLSDKAITGSAVFNVTPPSVGAYFSKIQCFCFTEQTLQPGETADMPVVFFVDPDLLEDADAENVKEITLSYTFYPVDKPKTAAAEPAAGTIAN